LPLRTKSGDEAGSRALIAIGFRLGAELPGGADHVSNGADWPATEGLEFRDGDASHAGLIGEKAEQTGVAGGEMGRPDNSDRLGVFHLVPPAEKAVGRGGCGERSEVEDA